MTETDEAPKGPKGPKALKPPVRGIIIARMEIHDVLADGKCSGVVGRTREAIVATNLGSLEEVNKLWEDFLEKSMEVKNESAN